MNVIKIISTKSYKNHTQITENLPKNFDKYFITEGDNFS